MSRYILFSILITALCVSGCQQSGGGGRQAAFDLSQRPRLFNFGAFQGGANRVAQNQTGWGYSGGQYSGGQQIAGRSNSGYTGQSPNGYSPGYNPQQDQQYANLSQQVQDLNGRIGRFDSDNQQLVTELAAMKQKLQVANDYTFQLRQQLADSTNQMQQIQMEKSAAEQQLANAQFQFSQSQQQMQQVSAATNQTANNGPNNGGARFASATLRANNSLMQKLPEIQIPGAQARMDGDVIRIEIPTDQLFNPGTYQVNAAHAYMIQNLATAIQRNFPRQIIGVEGHWDGSQIQPATTSHHQLTVSQSLAVFDYLTQLGLPQDQMFTMGMGSNRPRHPQGANANGINPNRRIEVVIYPESYE
jgi:flagellar motor protein MotB